MPSLRKSIGFITNNPYLRFPIRFFGLYFPLQWFYLAVISASDPGGKFYSPFVVQYFNVMNGVRSILLAGSEAVLGFINFSTSRFGEHGLCIVDGGRVSLNNGCLAWGIMSFWVAFIFANDGTWKTKAKWMLGGIAVICLINITRIVVLLVILTKKQQPVFAIEHHTLFNLVAYAFVFGLMYLFIRADKQRINQLQPNTAAQSA